MASVSSSSSSSKKQKKAAAEEASLPWIEKYRPKSLSDLIAHDHIISTINRLIDANRLPHLLFYGPPGTGKTSTIIACAQRLYGDKWKSMTLELNASDDRGIGVVRDQIKSFAGTMKLFSTGVKLVILDEADNMTADAQFALRRVIEKYTKNTRFCLICNYVSKIIPALQSRCTRFRFAPLLVPQIRGRLTDIIDNEKLTVTKDGVEAILRICGGDMRKVLNILQATSMSHDVVSAANVYICTGEPAPADIDAMVSSLLNDSFADCYGKITKLQASKGIALNDIVTRVAKVFEYSVEIPPSVKVELLSKLADLEYRLASGTSEKLQLGSLIGAFAIMREQLMKYIPDDSDHQARVTESA